MAGPRAVDPNQVYRLFPGVYRRYTELPDLVEARAEPVVLFPGSSDTPVVEVAAADMTVTQQGEEAVQQAVIEVIDRCAAATDAAVLGCPFGVNEFSRVPAGDDSIARFTAVDRTVEDYPEVTADPDGGDLVVVDRRAGTVTLTVSGHPAGGGSRLTGTITCPIRAGGLRLGIDVTGSVVPAQSVNGWSTDDPLFDMDIDDCR